jgi:hypothetical protein
MEIEEKIYFSRIMNYKPRINNLTPSENIQDINYLSSQIRNTAKYALNEEISITKAKREISDLLDNIKQLKRGIK